MEKLLDKLLKISSTPMHMPGHKRNTELAPYLKRLSADIDITEIDGFDNLHGASGILKKSMQRCAELRGADNAFYLVNGSTCGILAAVYACVSEGDKVICARNCHKSVYNALCVSHAEPIFIMPEREEKLGICGQITPRTVEELLSKNPDTKMVILTSPTYEGIISDIEEICKIAHKKNVPVLVDAAHGAHFGLSGFSECATKLGADIVAESLHKTLPSLTQTAVLYIKGSLVDSAKIADSLAVFETSSPSYILMSSIDGCIDLIESKGGALAKVWNNNLDAFYKNAEKLKNLCIFKPSKGFDKSKIVVGGAKGIKIAEGLRKMGIEPEMTAPCYVVLMTGMGDTEKSLKRLFDALLEIDKSIETDKTVLSYPEIPKRIMSTSSVKNWGKEVVLYKDAIGRISAEYIFAYPPGVPLIAPGEEITKELAEIFSEYEKSGVALSGSFLHTNGQILVVCS